MRLKLMIQREAKSSNKENKMKIFIDVKNKFIISIEQLLLATKQLTTTIKQLLFHITQLLLNIKN